MPICTEALRLTFLLSQYQKIVSGNTHRPWITIISAINFLNFPGTHLCLDQLALSHTVPEHAWRVLEGGDQVVAVLESKRVSNVGMGCFKPVSFSAKECSYHLNVIYIGNPSADISLYSSLSIQSHPNLLEFVCMIEHLPCFCRVVALSKRQ